ncbi:unnamed protein product [Prorocentrum cordatum]|uniref:Uncharacterized protein n=1 Tax=Prorocentrum cordatum TaxID=2364126 RepID=A0ABN9XXJ0_9DINO|nr:unnamed protein product [Polarella glacialis]
MVLRGSARSKQPLPNDAPLHHGNILRQQVAQITVSHSFDSRLYIVRPVWSSASARRSAHELAMANLGAGAGHPQQRCPARPDHYLAFSHQRPSSILLLLLLLLLRFLLLVLLLLLFFLL